MVVKLIVWTSAEERKIAGEFESFTNIFLFSSTEIKEFEKKKTSLNKLSKVYLTIYSFAKNLYTYTFSQGRRILLLLLCMVLIEKQESKFTLENSALSVEVKDDRSIH